jgi:hypothetical protein
MSGIFSITWGNLLKPPSRGRLPPQNTEMIRLVDMSGYLQSQTMLCVSRAFASLR